MPIGSRVRLRTRDVLVVGTVAAQRGDTLFLWTERHHTVPVPFATWGRLEISHGVHGHALKGLGLGLLAGAVVGGAIGAAVEPDELLGRGVNILAGVVLGSGGGALIGLGVGASIRSERWQPVSARVTRPSLLPAGRERLTVGMSLGF